jgi:hypothetical protein
MVMDVTKRRMNYKRNRRFRTELFKALKGGPKTTVQLYKVLKKNLPDDCDDGVKYKTMGGRKPEPEWKHRARSVLNSLQSEFIIYNDKVSRDWKIVE